MQKQIDIALISSLLIISAIFDRSFHLTVFIDPSHIILSSTSKTSLLGTNVPGFEYLTLYNSFLSPLAIVYVSLIPFVIINKTLEPFLSKNAFKLQLFHEQ